MALTCTYRAHAHLRTHKAGHIWGAHAQGCTPVGGAPACAVCVRTTRREHLAQARAAVARPRDRRSA